MRELHFVVQLPKCKLQSISQAEMITHRDAQIHLVAADCQRNIQQEKQRLLCGIDAHRRKRGERYENISSISIGRGWRAYNDDYIHLGNQTKTKKKWEDG